MRYCTLYHSIAIDAMPLCALRHDIDAAVACSSEDFLFVDAVVRYYVLGRVGKVDRTHTCTYLPRTPRTYYHMVSNWSPTGLQLVSK